MVEHWLVVGLGNPGRRYEKTYHNIGFMALEIFSQRHRLPISKIKFQGIYGEGRLPHARVTLLKPCTFMNLSGRSVREALAFYRLPVERCLVIVDDIDLGKGDVRIRNRGGAGTHNGLKSLIAELGSDQFPRVRIGIGPKPSSWDLADYVLSSVQPDEQDLFWQALNRACDAVELIVSGDMEAAMRMAHTPKAGKQPADESPKDDSRNMTDNG